MSKLLEPFTWVAEKPGIYRFFSDDIFNSDQLANKSSDLMRMDITDRVQFPDIGTEVTINFTRYNDAGSLDETGQFTFDRTGALV